MDSLILVIPTVAERSDPLTSVIPTGAEQSDPLTSVIPTGAERSERSGGTCFFSQVTSMPPPLDNSHPRLAAGCRWGGSEEDRVILFPEGAIKLQGTGRHVLERCDGQRTFGEIIAELQKQFAIAEVEKIGILEAADVSDAAQLHEAVSHITRIITTEIPTITQD